MQTQTPDPRSHVQRRRRRFPWMLGIIISSGFIIIFAFVVITLLVLRSQGPSQGINTLTIISIIGGFVISVLSLLVSFLQWHHPKDPSASEKIVASSFVQPHSPISEHLQSPIPLDDPQRQLIEKNTVALAPTIQTKRRFDWGEAPHVDQLYGRDKEVTTLKQWLVNDHCRLVVILGMGGIGKTGLAATLVDQVHEQYDYVFWRILYNAPPLESLLQECIRFFSLQTDTALPGEIDRQISLLLEAFRDHRCLLILDNAESILQGGSQTGHYREGYEGYGRLIQRIGESKHQSCLLITSREKPPEVALLEGEAARTRSFQLGGLKPMDGQGILKDKGLQGTENDWDVLFTHYGGNPLALKLVAQEIREVFGSTITTFLQDGELFFRNVRDVLEQQMKRLSAREEEIVYWLAIEREAITLSNLQEDITHPMQKAELQEAVSSLQRRQLIETSATGVTLHPVIMEYLTDRFVDRMCEEIKTERLEFFERYPLLKAQAKDYIRESQCLLILQPVLQRLLTSFPKETLGQRLQGILAILRTQNDYHISYAAGNVLNLLIQMGSPLRSYDFSHLVVRQAYLQGVALPGINFAHSDLTKSIFTESFGSIPSVVLSQQGDLLAAGTATGEIRVWHTVSGLPLYTFWGHTNWVHAVAFSPDGSILASGSNDQTVRLWEVNNGQCLKVLQGHTQEICSVAFSPDGSILASGSADQMVRLWEVNNGQCLKVLQSHTQEVRSVAFSPDGSILVSGSNDETVRLWEVNNGQCLKILLGHTNWVHSVDFSPNGSILASGSADETVRLWEVNNSQPLKILQGHTNWIKSVAFSPDGNILASGSADETVRLWEVSSGQCTKILQGHTQEIDSVAFSPDGNILASGSADETVRLWEVSSGQCTKILQGHTNWVRSVVFNFDGSILAGSYEDRVVRLWEVSNGQCTKILQGHTQEVRTVAFSPDGSMLASGSNDEVRLWEVSSGQCLKILHDHTNRVRSVAFSPDGSMLAGGYEDRAVRLWEVNSGQCLKTLQGHTRMIHSVAFSPDGTILASGSNDETIRLWKVNGGQNLNILQGHTNRIRSVAFSPDGTILASGSNDKTIRLWKVSDGQPLKTLQGHTQEVRSVAFSPDGSTLISGSDDQTVRLWEVSSGQCLKVLSGHTHVVYSVVFSPNGNTLASGSFDQTIRQWEVSSGQCLQILRSDRPYERMNISDAKGLTETQKATLKSLGAIEDEE